MDRRYNSYKARIDRRLAAIARRKEPASLYEPVRYVLAAGGKRLRAVLVLLACEAVGGNAAHAVDAAVAVEILHNFTLVHDDVMDHADLRRGNPTVHKEWNENVAILAGDQLVAYAYLLLLQTRPDRLKEVCGVFTRAFITVCEGQALDKEFETRRRVTLDEYRDMIGKKTAAMISAAAEIGGIIGGSTPPQRTALRTFGEHLGRAFQIRDDLLDVAGDPEAFGKTIGGDIIEGKKTYLLLDALQRVRGKERELLASLRPGLAVTRATIGRVRDIYRRRGTVDAAVGEIGRHTLRAGRALERLPRNGAAALLNKLSARLADRIS